MATITTFKNNPYMQTRTFPSLGLLALRLAMGSAFIFHGLGKVPAATSWMGDAAPGFIQAAAAYAELLGGAAIVLGLLTPVAALALLGVMSGALFMYHIPSGDPFVATAPGSSSYELALAYFAGSLLILLNSPGKFSLDYLIAKFLKRETPSSSGQVRYQT